jgi:hypothetical protein
MTRVDITSADGRVAMRCPIRLLVLALVMMTGSRADGEAITYSVGYNTHTQTGTVPLFDPALGPLHEVVFIGSGMATQSFHFNLPVSDVTYTGFIGVILDRPDGGTAGLGSGSFSGAEHFDPPGVTFVTVSGGATFGSDQTTGLAIFEGQGIAGVQMSAFIGVSPTPNVGELLFGLGSGTITYLYGLPEPSSWVMLLIAVAALGGVKIRHAIRPIEPAAEAAEGSNP